MIFTNKRRLEKKKITQTIQVPLGLAIEINNLTSASSSRLRNAQHQYASNTANTSEISAESGQGYAYFYFDIDNLYDSLPDDAEFYVPTCTISTKLANTTTAICSIDFGIDRGPKTVELEVLNQIDVIWNDWSMPVMAQTIKLTKEELSLLTLGIHVHERGGYLRGATLDITYSYYEQ